jgi:hypothetical protein
VRLWVLMGALVLVGDAENGFPSETSCVKRRHGACADLHAGLEKAGYAWCVGVWTHDREDVQERAACSCTPGCKIISNWNACSVSKGYARRLISLRAWIEVGGAPGGR